MGQEAAHREAREEQHPRHEGRLLSPVARAEQRQQHRERRQDDHQHRDAVDRHVVGETERRRQDVAGREVEGLGAVRCGRCRGTRRSSDEHELDARGTDRDEVGPALDLARQRRADRPGERDDEQERSATTRSACLADPRHEEDDDDREPRTVASA